MGFPLFLLKSGNRLFFREKGPVSGRFWTSWDFLVSILLGDSKKSQEVLKWPETGPFSLKNSLFPDFSRNRGKLKKQPSPNIWNIWARLFYWTTAIFSKKWQAYLPIKFSIPKQYKILSFGDQKALTLLWFIKGAKRPFINVQMILYKQKN